MATATVPDNQPSDILPVSRQAATIANLVHQYVTVGLSIINGVVLVPLYLKYIDFKLYGAWLATGSIVAWLGMVDAGISEIIRQQTARAYGSKDASEIGRAMSTGMICNAAVGLMPAIIGVIAAPFLGSLFHLEPAMAKELSYSFFLAALSCSFVVIGGAASAGLQGIQRNISVCAIYVISSLTGIAITIWMLLKGYSVKAIPTGLLVRGVIWTILYWGYAYYLSHCCLGIRWHFSRKHLRQIINLTSWTFFYKISHEIINQCDALVVGLMLGVEFTPIFVLTRRAWDILRIFLTRIGVAFMPALAHLHGEDDQDKYAYISRRLLRVCIYAAILGASTCMAMNSTFIHVWVGSKLYAGHLFDAIIATSMIVMIHNWTINSILYARGIIKQPAAVGIGQNLLRAILLILLVWLWHINGTVASMLLGSIVAVPYFVYRWRTTQQNDRPALRSEYSHYILSVVVLLTFGGVVSHALSLHTWTGFIIAATVYTLISVIILAITDKYFRVESQLILKEFLSRHRIHQ
jgi:O-antigen/teichoic acid export membrane protein